jgi:riboflavin kinase / FMN adenylyltransferase
LKIYRNIDEYGGTEFAIVTVGTFDGLHIGHQKIIRRMAELAEEHNGETVVVTFNPHPRLVLEQGNTNLKFITTEKKKYELLEALGIDQLIILPFTKEFAAIPSADFIRDYLVNNLKVKMLVVGYDHHFGRNREGNFDQLFKQGIHSGFGVEEIPAQYIDDIPVSSTQIRNALTEGNLHLANRMLGYDYSITGHVIKGNRIGRSLGFPTANLDVDDKYKLIAAGGVYACRVEYKGKMYNGMGNIGTRPTIGKHDFITEVHIFNFNEEIYGKEITIYFIDRVRDERKFGGLDELKEQLGKDREVVRKLLNG